MKKLILILILLSLNIYSAHAESINQLQTQIRKIKLQQKDLTQQLQKSETTLGDLEKYLKSTRQKIIFIEKKLKKLQNQVQKDQTTLKQTRQKFAEQIRLSYQLGQTPQFKIFFSGQDPQSLKRLFTYQRYFNQAQIALINDLNQNLDTLSANQYQLAQKKETLGKLKIEQSRFYQHIIVKQQERKNIIKKLDTQLSAQEKQLNTLLKNIAKQKTVKPSKPLPSFAAKQHHLPWPTRGMLTKKENLPGVFIKAPAGQPIRAVSAGKVVFSHWLRGFGLLLIIDHGEGFMTLYAHNQSLYKKQQEFVQAGDLIATVGNTGGHNEHALYFEVRQNGKPKDPRQWCVS